MTLSKQDTFFQSSVNFKKFNTFDIFWIKNSFAKYSRNRKTGYV